MLSLERAEYIRRLADNLNPSNSGELKNNTIMKPTNTRVFEFEDELEIEKELIFFQAWMVRYGKNPKDINLINDYLKTKK